MVLLCRAFYSQGTIESPHCTRAYRRGCREFAIIRLRLRRSISIVIPAYNEEKRLPSTLARVRQYLDASHWEFAEIIVVDDGSRDATAAVAEAAGARVLRNPGNRGKGYSVRHGILKATGNWSLFSDADLSSPIIEELDRLWGSRRTRAQQVVIGSRAVDRLDGGRSPADFPRKPWAASSI